MAATTAPPLLAVPATEAQNGFGRLVDQAAAGQDIAITRHNIERVVLVSAVRYHQLVAGARGTRETPARDVAARETPTLDRLTAEFEELFASMQTPEVRAATARALQATPEQMGQAAVAAAQQAAQERARGADYQEPSRAAEPALG